MDATMNAAEARTYIVDYRVNGLNDFKCVRAASAGEALAAFRSAGIDGWTGIAFRDYEVTRVSER